MKSEIDEAPIGRLLKITNYLFETYINNDLKKMNLTHSQIGVLIYICKNSKIFNIKQMDIEKRFSLTNPTVTGILNRLEEKGFIERTINVEDARCKKVIPTEKATQIVNRGYNEMIRTEDKILGCLSNEEREDLRGMLIKIINNNIEEDEIND